MKSDIQILFEGKKLSMEVFIDDTVTMVYAKVMFVVKKPFLLFSKMKDEENRKIHFGITKAFELELWRTLESYGDLETDRIEIQLIENKSAQEKEKETTIFKNIISVVKSFDFKFTNHLSFSPSFSSPPDQQKIDYRIDLARVQNLELADQAVIYDKIQPSLKIPVIQWKQFYKVNLKNNLKTLKALIVERSFKNDEYFWAPKNTNEGTYKNKDRIIFRTEQSSTFVKPNGSYDVWFISGNIMDKEKEKEKEKKQTKFDRLIKEIDNYNDCFQTILKPIDVQCLTTNTSQCELMELKVSGQLSQTNIDLKKLAVKLSEDKGTWTHIFIDSKKNILTFEFKRFHGYYSPENIDAWIKNEIKTKNIAQLAERAAIRYDLTAAEAKTRVLEAKDEAAEVAAPYFQTGKVKTCVIEISGALGNAGQFKIKGKLREYELYRCLNHIVNLVEQKSNEKKGKKEGKEKGKGKEEKKVKNLMDLLDSSASSDDFEEEVDRDSDDEDSEEEDKSHGHPKANQCPVSTFEKKDKEEQKSVQNMIEHAPGCTSGFQYGKTMIVSDDLEKKKDHASQKKPMLIDLNKSDRPLFVWGESDKKAQYASKCQSSANKQPAVMTQEQYLYNQKCFPGAMRGILANYGSSDEKRKTNVYACPDIWFPKLKIGMTKDQYDELNAKPNPFWTLPKYNDDPLILTSDKDRHKPKYLQLKTIPNKTDGFCYPCCGYKEATDKKGANDYLLNEQSIESDRYSYLADQFSTFVDVCKQGDKDDKTCFAQFGLPISDQPFLSFIDEYVCKDFIAKTKRNLTNTLYVSLNNGDVCRAFFPQSSSSSSSSFEDVIVASKGNFIKWLENEEIFKSYEYILDLVTKAHWVTSVFKFNLLVLLAPNYHTNMNNLVTVERAYAFDEKKDSMVLIVHNNKQYSLLCRQQGDEKEKEKEKDGKDKKIRARVKPTAIQKWIRYHTYSAIKKVADCANYLNKEREREREKVEDTLSRMPSFKPFFSSPNKEKEQGKENKKIKITQLVDNRLLAVAYFVEVEGNKNLKLMVPLKTHAPITLSHDHIQSIWSYFEQGPYSNPALVKEWMASMNVKTKDLSLFLVSIPLTKESISTHTEMQINRSLFETTDRLQSPKKENEKEKEIKSKDYREDKMVALIDREKNETQRIKATNMENKDLVARLRKWVEDRALTRSDALTFAHLEWNLNEREASDLLFPPPRIEDEDHQFILEFTKDELLGSQIDFILAVSQNRPSLPDVQFVCV